MITHTILDKIVHQKQIRLKQEKSKKTFDQMVQDSESLKRNTLDFVARLKAYKSLAIIAEVKKASPSKGLIRENFNPIEIAGAYLKSDVQGISVITEQDFFQGDPVFLKEIRELSNIPILRKDFIFDEYQIYESYLLGADAVLLIAAILDDEGLEKMQITANQLGLQTLVEIHDETELFRVLHMKNPPNMIGINNRNLHTFTEDLKTTGRLINKIKKFPDICVVSESAMKTPRDLKYIKSLDIDAVLIGEAFMRSTDIVKEVEYLRSFDEEM